MTKILLIEDHEELWDSLSRRLKRAGFTVILAEDGQQGLDKARSEAPDVILLDLNLPVIDGWTVARTLQQAEATRAIPMIALTAQGRTSLDLDAAAVFTAYHLKPVDVPRLIGQIEDVLLTRPDVRP